jgi:KDO2-lipid IV(A) lauroyltransferase
MDIKKFWKEDMQIDGMEYLAQARAAGQGVIIASAHYANPEFAVQGLAAVGIKVFALVEPLDPPELGRLMRSLRTVNGHIYAPVSFGAIKDALTWLRNGGVVAILVDRDIQKRGIVLDFCGAPARFPTGAVDLAIRTNAMLLPGWVRRTGGFKIHTRLGPPLELIRTGDREEDLRVNTAALLALFEKHLKEDPGQWSVVDRIWPEDLQPKSSAPSTAAK